MRPLKNVCTAAYITVDSSENIRSGEYLAGTTSVSAIMALNSDRWPTHKNWQNKHYTYTLPKEIAIKRATVQGPIFA